MQIPNIFTSFSPKFFWQFFSWIQSCQQLKSPKPQHFHEFFIQIFFWHFFSWNQSWIFGQKMKISNSVFDNKIDLLLHYSRESGESQRTEAKYRRSFWRLWQSSTQMSIIWLSKTPWILSKMVFKCPLDSSLSLLGFNHARHGHQRVCQCCHFELRTTFRT